MPVRRRRRSSEEFAYPMGASYDFDAFEYDWTLRSACRGVDPDVFYPGRGESTRPAKKICDSCVVKAPCLEFALASSERQGVWGGHSERERRHLRKVRARSAVDLVPSKPVDQPIEISSKRTKSELNHPAVTAPEKVAS